MKKRLLSFQTQSTSGVSQSIGMFLLLLFFALNVNLFSQSTANYAFSTATNGSLTDMSSGTTNLLIGASLDDISSSVATIGFNFVLMGKAYTQFSVNSNGALGLGSTPVATSGTGTGTSTAPVIAPFGGDQGVLTTGGKVHYKVTGSAPNRILVVEWLNMKINFSGYATALTGDGTYQALFYETTGKVEFIYGKMSVATAFSTGPVVGISAGTSANQTAAVTTSTNAKTDGTAWINNTYSVGDIANLNSAADGSRRVYTFTPSVTSPNPPSALNFTAISLSGMTLNWTDSDNEQAYAIFRSSDGGTNFTLVANAALNAVSYVATGLNPGVGYVWRVYALNEGRMSTALEGTQATTSPSLSGTFTIGPSGTYATLTAAITAVNSQGLAGATILELMSDYVSTSETFPISFPNIPGLSVTNTLTVRPAAGATGRVITSANTTATLRFNGSTYVIFDGRPGGSGTARELTITNTSVSGPAILFIEDAISNTLTYCNVTGTANVSTSSGLILFSTSASGTQGNDNNTISYCDINATGSAQAIYALGTSSKDNSGNQILNNNIHDFYISSASTTSTYGIRLGAANTNWTISGNSFYQSSSRSYSATSALHYILSISNSTTGAGFTITDNYLGGSGPLATGTYTMTAGQQRLFAMDLVVGTSTPTSIQNNTITNIACSTAFTTTGSSGILGMNLSAGSFNVGTVTGNTIGSTTATGAINLHLTGASGPLFVGISCATTSGTTVIQNNRIGGLLASTTTSTAYLSLYPISLSGSGHTVTIADNVIGSTTVANSIYNNTGGTSTSTYQTRGMNITSTGVLSITGNTIANLTASGTGSATTMAGIYISATPGSTGWTMTGNTVRNLTNASTSTTFGSILGALTGMAISGSQNHQVSGNTIHSLVNNASSAAVTVAGIYFAGSASLQSRLEKNFIHSLQSTTTSNTAVITGILITGGLHSLRNNMIRMGIDKDGASVTNSNVICGIYKNVGTVGSYFHNSVYIGGTGVSAGTGKSFAFRKTGTSGADSLFNNIFFNARSNTTPAGAKHYAYGVNQSSGLVSNFNVIFANGTDGMFGTKDDGTTSYSNIADLRTGFGTDANSLGFNPNFTTPSGSSAAVDLHISNPTVIEASGTPIAYVTEDFDNQARSGLTPTDIGADAGNFTPLDLAGPVISYTNLGNSAKMDSRSVTGITITDASGVNVTSGTAPRIYYKKSTDQNLFSGNTSGDDGWKWVESGNPASPFSFDIDYSIIFGGTVSAGEIIQYFVVAQDLATTPNVGINSGSFTVTPASVDLDPTVAPIGGTIKSYTIVPSITGVVLVGTGQTYTSLTANDGTGLFKAINDRVVTGNITAKITSDITETGAVALNQSVEEAIYTIKIVPNDATLKTVSGAVADGMIRLNGADGVVFDGRFNETGSTSYLTFRNTNTSNPVFTFLNSSSSNTIRNCVIEGASTSGSSAVVFFSTGDNTGNQIIETQIRDLTTTAARPLYGVYFNALTNNNNTIKNCSIFNFTTAGVYVNTGTNVTVESNLIYMTSASTVATVTGVYAQNAPGLRVVKNKIYDLNGSSSAAIRGLYYVGVSGTSMIVTMENNLIHLSPSTTGTVDGVDYFGYSTNSLNMYFNSIYIGGTLASGTNGSSGIRKRDVALAFDLKDNVVQNARSNSGGTASHYAINFSTNTVTTLTMNYNDYYTSGTGGVLGYWSSNKTTIADWRTATSQDANSLNADPLFRAADNLQPFVGSPILASGTPVSGITTDYTGTTRNATNPSIGAYETGYTPPGVDWANLQWPSTMSLKEGVKGDVYAQVYKAGVTEPAGQGAGISVWIGVSATNTNPNTWTSWTAATFNTQSGNNDEYTAQIGGTLAAGTYYYATRVLLEGGIYQYGGYNGGFWDGTTNVSGVLTVTDGVITYANLQFPSTASINEGGSATIYGRVYAEGVTTVAGGSPGIVCQIGWNSANTDPSTWSNWTTATFNAQFGNNDEYQATIGSGLTTGTFYYATRFKLINDTYFYGGYSGTGGGAWDGTTNVSGVLTVNPFIANVPYIQNFDGVTAPALPAGWTVLDANNDTYKWSNAASNPRTSPNAMKAVYNSVVTTTAMDDWFFSPGINLQAGVEYEVIFYYRAEDATYTEKLEVKWGTAANVAGMTGGTLFTNSSITNITYSKGSGSFTPSSSGVFYIGFHGFSAADQWNLYVDDVTIRVKPAAINSQTIAANNTTLFTFTGTGAQVQFTTGNTGSVTLQFEKIPGNPRGTLPSPVLNVANTYWTGTVTSGTVNGTYTLTLDLTGVPGIGNPATIHLLKRSDINGSWVDIGYPTNVSAFPLVSWANIASGFSDFGLGGENDNPLPVELVNFTGKAKSRNVNLNWETKTETDNSGFEVERKDKNGDWNKIGFVEGSGSSNSPKYYSFEDKKLSSGKHSYRLKQLDNDGTTSYSDEVEVTIDVPTEFAMSQNYPNPFNPSTKVDYQLAMDAKVTIELYSITGEKVVTLLSQELEAGYYSMMIDSYTHNMASGIYIYRMIATDALGKSFVSTKKLSLIK